MTNSELIEKLKSGIVAVFDTILGEVSDEEIDAVVAEIEPVDTSPETWRAQVRLADNGTDFHVQTYHPEFKDVYNKELVPANPVTLALLREGIAEGTLYTYGSRYGSQTQYAPFELSVLNGQAYLNLGMNGGVILLKPETFQVPPVRARGIGSEATDAQQE